MKTLFVLIVLFSNLILTYGQDYKCYYVKQHVSFLANGKEIENLDTRDSPGLPIKMTIRIRFTDEGLQFDNKNIGSINVKVRVFFKLSESADCLYPINPRITSKKILFEGNLTHAQFVSNDGYVIIEKEIKTADFFDVKVLKEDVALNEMLIETTISQKGTHCLHEYHRQLCSQLPVSIIPGR